MSKDADALLAALLNCHRVQIDLHKARPASAGVTTIIRGDNTICRRWSRPALPAKASVKLTGDAWRHARCRQRKAESIEALLWRALAELSRREVSGMPKPDPKAQRRRKLRKLLDNADTGNPM